MDFQINYWAVLVSGIAAMFIGGFWYSPLLFGNIWIKLTGMTEKDIKAAKNRGMALSYFLNFVGALVMAFVLSHFLQVGGAETVQSAMMIAFWLWLGFIATVSLGTVLWENKSWKLWLLNNAYNLLTLLVMSAILTAWK